MSIEVTTVTTPRAGLAPCIATNAATVGTIYFVQALAAANADIATGSPIAQFGPAASLAGYAAGVAYCAFVAENLCAIHAFVIHLCFLVASVLLVALAPEPSIQALGCLCVGFGCSLTQRLMALASRGAGDPGRSRAIGQLIAGGLTGIVFARVCAGTITDMLGAQTLLLLLACLIGTAGSIAAARNGDVSPCRDDVGSDRLSALAALRRHAALRTASLQLAVVFAVYNFSWIGFIRHAGFGPAASAAIFGTVSAMGAVTALLTGRIVARRDPLRSATFGVSMIVFATLLAPAAAWIGSGWIGLMLMVEIGTQIVLVSNQSRAQRLARTPQMRGRIAAIVTTIGFLGGAAGAGLGTLTTGHSRQFSGTTPKTTTHVPLNIDDVSLSRRDAIG